MMIQESITNHLSARTAACRALVVYDPEQRYGELVAALAGDNCTVIDGSRSTIEGREEAMDAWRSLAAEDELRLVVYLPIKKPATDAARQRNPYQIFALSGGEFPSGDGESYQALCHQAAPEHADKIDALFAAGTPDFETINTLIGGKANWPKLKTLLGAESPAEILVALLSPTDRQERQLEGDSSWLPEAAEFMAAAIHLALKTKSKKAAVIREELWRFVLFSEFALDLPGGLPEALKDVPHAPETVRAVIYTVCDQLRHSENHQTRYMEAAEKVSEDMQLMQHLAGVTDLGRRDTFAFEERAFLSVFTQAALAGDYGAATELAQRRERSIWVRHVAERQQLWTIADRALRLLVAAEDEDSRVKGLGGHTVDAFDYYRDTFRQVDHLHRSFEQAVTDAYGELDDVEGLVEAARARYLKIAEALQTTFVGCVENEGWPVSGRPRLTEVFAKFVAPLLESRKKVAYFLVDALRYELAMDLENELAGKFNLSSAAVCANLPTITQVGMAALLPGADGSLRLESEGHAVIPHIGDRRIVTPSDRFEHVQAVYGDRCHMRDLDELVTKPKIKIPETTQLLIIKTTDIDQFGETNPLEARRMMPRLIQKIIAGVNRVQKRGFDRAVIATDHGFLLFDEQGIGNVVPKPPGEWFAIKDRCLLGTGSSGAGVLVLKAAEAGIQSSFQDYAVPRTFATFAKTNPYFHEGLSLQECVLPVLVVDFGEGEPEGVSTSVELNLSYKGGKTGKVTTRRPMVEVMMYKTGLFEEPAEFRLDAYAQNELVAEAAACPHVNPASGLVQIAPGQAIKVPLKMSEDFEGSFEVRAVDPVTGVNYATLRLKTDYLG